MDETECPSCGRTDFKNRQGMKIHHSRVHGESLSTVDVECSQCGETVEKYPSELVSDRYFCDSSCKGRWDKKHRTHRYANHVLGGPKGYEKWRFEDCGVSRTVGVHQLLMVANGEDPYKVFGNADYNVHHVNGAKLDNRPRNLVLMGSREHGQKTFEETYYSYEDLESVVRMMMDASTLLE